MAGGQGHIPQLDGVRGFAVAAIMVFHSQLPLLSGLFVSLDLFFVLSGYLITRLLAREFGRNGTISFRHFYMRRALRLGPALLLFLSVVAVASLLLLDEEGRWRNLREVLFALFYFSNWARAFDIHPPLLLGHTWSLSVEEQFYLLWPPLLLLGMRLQRLRHWLPVIIAGLALLAWGWRVLLTMEGASVARLYNGLDTRADALLLGCLTGWLVGSGWLEGRRKVLLQRCLRLLSPLALLALAAFFLWANYESLQMYYWGFFLVDVVAAVLVLDLALGRDGWIRRLFASRPLVWFGTLSYGLYLWHYPVFYLMLHGGFAPLTVLLLGGSLAVALACLSWYGLERPCLRLKRHFQGGDRGQAAVATGTS